MFEGILITKDDDFRLRHPPAGYRLVWLRCGNITNRAKTLNRGKSVLHDKPIYMEAERDGVAMEIALQYNDGFSQVEFSFANTINTIDGGAHLTGFRSALTRVLGQDDHRRVADEMGVPMVVGERADNVAPNRTRRALDLRAREQRVVLEVLGEVAPEKRAELEPALGAKLAGPHACLRLQAAAAVAGDGSEDENACNEPEPAVEIHVNTSLTI